MNDFPTVFYPVAWYTPTAASNPIPCRWVGYDSCGRWWEIVVYDGGS